jgi:hypothetical protein
MPVSDHETPGFSTSWLERIATWHASGLPRQIFMMPVGFSRRRISSWGDALAGGSAYRLKHKVPSGTDWVHEIKHDGYRLQVRRVGDPGAAVHARRLRLEWPLPGGICTRWKAPPLHAHAKNGHHADVVVYRRLIQLGHRLRRHVSCRRETIPIREPSNAPRESPDCDRGA